MNKPLHLPTRILNLYRSLYEFQTCCTVQIVSITPCCPKAADFRWPPLWELWAEDGTQCLWSCLWSACGSASGHILSMNTSTIFSGHLTDKIEAHCFSTTFDYFLGSSLISPFCSSKWLMQLRLENQDLGQCSLVRLHIRTTGESVSTQRLWHISGYLLQLDGPGVFSFRSSPGAFNMHSLIRSILKQWVIRILSCLKNIYSKSFQVLAWIRLTWKAC